MNFNRLDLCNYCIYVIFYRVLTTIEMRRSLQGNTRFQSTLSSISDEDCEVPDLREASSIQTVQAIAPPKESLNPDTTMVTKNKASNHTEIRTRSIQATSEVLSKSCTKKRVSIFPILRCSKLQALVGLIIDVIPWVIGSVWVSAVLAWTYLSLTFD